MNDLLRELAPVSGSAWSQIEAEAKRTLKEMLAARRLVEFCGPLGWDSSAVGTGRTRQLAAPAVGAETRVREVQPLVEVRVPFRLAREELEAVERGARDPDLNPVRTAARVAALAEDRAIFHGYSAAGITGLTEAAADRALRLSENYEEYPGVVAKAVNRLRTSGVDGPYGIALGPRCHTGLTRTTQGGYPVMEHVRRLLDGPLVWAPGIDGAAVVSLRGGDFELSVGQDFSIGYLEHYETAVRLYVQESFTFRVLSPEACVPLAYAEP